MSFVTIGLLISLFSVVVLSLLFNYEERTGNRFLQHVRVHADVFALSMARTIRETLRFVAKDLIKQSARYVFHRVLSAILLILRRIEGFIRNAIRNNKTLAKNVDEERETRSKLEEVAFHKATNALSEEEKRLHRDKMLEG